MSQALPVLVETWQFECCGDSFAIGDEVSWRLSFVTDDLPIRAARTTIQGIVGAELTSEAGGTTGSVLTTGGLVAWVRPVQPAGPAELHGTLVEDHHGLVPEELPRTRGRIERIRAVSVAYIRDVSSFAGWASGADSPNETPDREEGELLVDLVIG